MAGFKVIFSRALTGDIMATVDVQPPPPPRWFIYPGHEAETQQTSTLSVPSVTLMEAFKLAKINPFMYRVILDGDIVLEPEAMLTYTIKQQGDDDFAVQLIALESLLEVQWFIASETHFQGAAMQCTEALPSVFVDNDKANVAVVLSQLMLAIPAHHTNLIHMIEHDILAIPQIRRRKLDVARKYDNDLSRWVIGCVLLVKKNGKLALKLTGSEMQTQEKAGVLDRADVILQDIATIII